MLYRSSKNSMHMPRHRPLRALGIGRHLASVVGIVIIARVLALPANASDPLVRAANHILAHQVSDGAIVMGTQPQRRSRIIPYCANLAGLGLVAAFRTTGESNYLSAARRWVTWYASHTNRDGTIDDFEGVVGNWKRTGHYDSSDSYAATFLELVCAIDRAAPDKPWLESIRPAAQGAIDAIRLTLQTNGLTWARPDWPVMYLMDNTETARGLRAAAQLRFDTEPLAAAMDESIRRRLWNESAETYAVGLDKNGKQVKAAEAWYPFVMANLMAVAWLARQAHHEPLLRRLEDRHRDLIPTAVKTEEDLDRLVWWGMAAQTAENESLRLRVVAKLTLFDAELKTFKDPNLLGHLCRILARERF
jgi:hypothetical protein